MIRVLSSALVVLLLGLFTTGAAFAEDELEESDILGSIEIKMNLQFARVLVNGESWEAHDFVGNGKTVVVRNLPRDRATTIRLEPIEAGYAPQDVTVEGKDFKKKVTKKGKTRILAFVAKSSVKFDKAAPAPAGGDADHPEKKVETKDDGSGGEGKLDPNDMDDDE